MILLNFEYLLFCDEIQCFTQQATITVLNYRDLTLLQVAQVNNGNDETIITYYWPSNHRL